MHRAIALQRALDSPQPLLEEQLVHTHNSYNSSSYRVPTTADRPGYYPTLTNQDPNQVYSLTDQLQLDVRVVELDLHWVPSIFGSAATGGRWVTLCHGNSNEVPSTGVTVHVGCTIDRPLQDGLQELATWLKANPDEVLLVYLENQLNNDPAGHATAGDLLKTYLGPLVFPTPTGQPCAPMPVTISRDEIRASGHRVLLVGNCDAGRPNSWGTQVYERGPTWDEHGDPSAYDAKQCSADSAVRLKDTSFRRYYEDSTWLAATDAST